MLQTVALIGTILDGLSDRQHPMGTCLYAVRDAEHFLYIGRTLNGAWSRIRGHRYSEDTLGIALGMHWPTSKLWRVEVCNFLCEDGVDLLERELIRRYHPPLNDLSTTRHPSRQDRRLERVRSIIGPACRAILDQGWPSFAGIDLETGPRRRRAAPTAPGLPDDVSVDDPVARERYHHLSVVKQAILQFWIAHAVVPARSIYRGDLSEGLRFHFEELGFRIDIQVFRGAMLAAGYAPIWASPHARDCAYRLKRAMRRGQGDSKWRHRTGLDHVPAFAYTWYWSADALQRYRDLLVQIGPEAAQGLERVWLLLAIQLGHHVDRSLLH